MCLCASCFMFFSSMNLAPRWPDSNNDWLVGWLVADFSDWFICWFTDWLIIDSLPDWTVLNCLLCFFSTFRSLRFADCETVSVDENMIGKEAAVIANCDANFEFSTWKHCSAECLRKLLPSPACYVFGRRASLSMLDHGLAGSDTHSQPPADSGLWVFAVG